MTPEGSQGSLRRWRWASSRTVWGLCACGRGRRDRDCAGRVRPSRRRRRPAARRGDRGGGCRRVHRRRSGRTGSGRSADSGQRRPLTCERGRRSASPGPPMPATCRGRSPPAHRPVAGRRPGGCVAVCQNPRLESACHIPRTVETPQRCQPHLRPPPPRPRTRERPSAVRGDGGTARQQPRSGSGWRGGCEPRGCGTPVRGTDTPRVAGPPPRVRSGAVLAGVAVGRLARPEGPRLRG